MTSPEGPPIACTLVPGDFKDRVAWIVELNRDSLRSHQRRGLTLCLSYAPEAASRVREMLSKEQECCAFLSFDMSESQGEVRLTITAPEHASEAAQQLFEHFVASAPADTTGPAIEQAHDW